MPISEAQAVAVVEDYHANRTQLFISPWRLA
jgi:hypothetical protein